MDASASKTSPTLLEMWRHIARYLSDRDIAALHCSFSATSRLYEIPGFPNWLPVRTGVRHYPTSHQLALYHLLDTTNCPLFLGYNAGDGQRFITTLYYLAQHPTAVWVVSRPQLTAIREYARRLRWSSERVVLREREVADEPGLTTYRTVLFETSGGPATASCARTLQWEGGPSIRVVIIGAVDLDQASRASREWRKVVEYFPDYTTVPDPPLDDIHPRDSILHCYPVAGKATPIWECYASLWASLGTHVLCCYDAPVDLAELGVAHQPASPYQVALLHPATPAWVVIDLRQERVTLEALCVTDLVLLNPGDLTLDQYRRVLSMVRYSSHHRTIRIHHVYTNGRTKVCLASKVTITQYLACRQGEIGL
jgi:hypothetical protein